MRSELVQSENPASAWGYNALDFQVFLASLREKVRDTLACETPLDEVGTRNDLVLPLLEQLGWNNRLLVRFWFETTKSDEPRRRISVIECSGNLIVLCRALDTPIDHEEWILQAETYSDVLESTWCLVTNGDGYRLYCLSAPGEMSNKLFWEVKLSSRASDRYLADLFRLLGQDMQTSQQSDEVWRALWRERLLEASLEDVLSSRPDWLVKRLRRGTSYKVTSEEVHRWLATAKLAAGYSRQFFPNFRQNVDPGKHKRYRQPTGRLPRTDKLFNAELIRTGMVLTIRGRDNSSATVVDGKLVKFQGAEMSFNEWGKAVTGWQAICIYEYAVCADGRTLDQLRRLLGPSY